MAPILPDQVRRDDRLIGQLRCRMRHCSVKWMEMAFPGPILCQGKPSIRAWTCSTLSSIGRRAGTWPSELAMVKSACRQPDIQPVVYQDFHVGSAAVGEQISTGRLRRTEDRNHAGHRGIGAGAHVHRLSGEPDVVDAAPQQLSNETCTVGRTVHRPAHLDGHTRMLDFKTNAGGLSLRPSLVHLGVQRDERWLESGRRVYRPLTTGLVFHSLYSNEIASYITTSRPEIVSDCLGREADD